MNQTKLQFNQQGLLAPNEPYQLDTRTFKELFVDAFPQSTQRRWLYDNYIEYTQNFQEEIFPYFEQWINGSFVTQKENPNDLDMVTYLDHRIFEQRGEKLEKYFSFALENKGIDAYIVSTHPKGHAFYAQTEEMRARWYARFTNVKSYDVAIRSKGFIKIIHEK